MADIKAADVAKLRKVTGAGMMDCKKALQETNGDFEKAIEEIRKKGKAIANKRADRDATEGVVLAKTNADATVGAMIILNCETDFVAKNDEFVKFADAILDKALENNASDLEALKAIEMDGRTIGDHVTEQTGVIGEKIDLSAYFNINAGFVVPYIHPGNKLATIVAFNQAADIQIGKDVAMQIAAMSPVSIDKDDVPADVIEKELEIGRAQAREEGKPEAMLDKIAEGKLSKFFKDSTLMNQTFVKDGKISVGEYLKGINAGLKVEKFERYSLNN
ncbi:MAG: elongation factor Ts [Bacteroidales bacterium]|nr:elongation factor Ts [Bacteroidales bacterium]